MESDYINNPEPFTESLNALQAGTERIKSKDFEGAIRLFEESQQITLRYFKDDFLALANLEGKTAKAYVKLGSYDKAWHHFHEQKNYYAKHANKEGLSAQGFYSLDSCVHEQMADMLRIEKKHGQALIHIVYWVLAQKHNPKQKHYTKFKSYFNRCKFNRLVVDECWASIQNMEIDLVTDHPFTIAKNVVANWS